MVFRRIRPQVGHELFVLSYRNLPVHALGQIFLSSIVAVESWPLVRHNIILAWIAWGVVTTMALVAGILGFRRAAQLKAPDAPTLRRWKWIHPVLLSFVGVSWGGAGYLLVPEAAVHCLVVLTAFAGVLGYSALSNAPNDPIGFAISASIGVLVLVTQLPRTFGSDAWSIVAMSILYLSVLGLAARNARVTLLASIELRLDNEILARDSAANAARAEQANRDKSAFLAAASHDLRQPVHALLLLLEAYRQAVPTAAAHPLMRHITAAGQSIRSLFNALMELSRLESSTDKPESSAVNVAELVRHTIARMRLEAQDKGLQLRTFISRNLRWTTAFVDRYMLDRIIGNLLANAVKYTKHGGYFLACDRRTAKVAFG